MSITSEQSNMCDLEAFESTSYGAAESIDELMNELNQEEVIVEECDDDFSGSAFDKGSLKCGNPATTHMQACHGLKARTQLKSKSKQKNQEEDKKLEEEQKLAAEINKVMSIAKWVGSCQQPKHKSNLNVTEYPSLANSKKKTVSKSKLPKTSKIPCAPRVQVSAPKVVEKFVLYNASYNEEKNKAAVALAAAAVATSTPSSQQVVFEKTRMCSSVLNGTTCPHGVGRCRFAHSQDELAIRACLNGSSCKFVTYENGKIENNTHVVKVCMFLHPYEMKEDYKVRVTGRRVVEKKVEKKTEKKVEKVEKKIEKVEKKVEKVDKERKTPEELQKQKEEKNYRALVRFAEKQFLEEVRREEQEKAQVFIEDDDTPVSWEDALDEPVVVKTIAKPVVSTPSPVVTPSTPVIVKPIPVTPSSTPIKTVSPVIVAPVQTSTIKLTQAVSLKPIEIVKSTPSPSPSTSSSPSPIPSVVSSAAASTKAKHSSICRTVEAGNKCPYGDRCLFAHYLEDFEPKLCNFGRNCRFVIMDSDTFVNNPCKDRPCFFRHEGESRDNYFTRVKIYSHIPKSRLPAPKVQPEVPKPKIIEHAPISKATNAWSGQPAPLAKPLAPLAKQTQKPSSTPSPTPSPVPTLVSPVITSAPTPVLTESPKKEQKPATKPVNTAGLKFVRASVLDQQERVIAMPKTAIVIKKEKQNATTSVKYIPIRVAYTPIPAPTSSPVPVQEIEPVTETVQVTSTETVPTPEVVTIPITPEPFIVQRDVFSKITKRPPSPPSTTATELFDISISRTENNTRIVMTISDSPKPKRARTLDEPKKVSVDLPAPAVHDSESVVMMKFVPVSSPAEYLVCHRQVSRPAPRTTRQITPLFALVPQLVAKTYQKSTTPPTPSTPMKKPTSSTFEPDLQTVSRCLSYE